MHERIYTIPVNQAFEQADECPFCLLYEQLEKNEIDLITGASMMEPDVRIKTNELGFCRKHFDMMFASKTRLPLALTIQTHLDELRKDIKPGGIFSGDASSKPVKRIEKLEHDCYVCGRIENHYDKMFETACGLFEEENEFRNKFASQKYFCLPHYKKLLVFSKKVNSKRWYPELCKAAEEIETSYINSLYDDISLFCKKFDYNYHDVPWGNSKDSVERAINFIAGK